MIKSYQGKTPEFGQRCYIDESSVLVGDLQAGDDVSIWPFVAARGDVHHIRIGHRSNIQDGTVLHVTHDGPYSPGGKPLIIGDDVTVGHKALLHACTIGDRCLIGMGAIVMDGAVLESDVLLAAGAVVTPDKQLKSGYLYRGNPAREARALTESEMAMLKYSAANYVKVKNNYLAEVAS